MEPLALSLVAGVVVGVIAYWCLALTGIARELRSQSRYQKESLEELRCIHELLKPRYFRDSDCVIRGSERAVPPRVWSGVTAGLAEPNISAQ